MNSTIIRMNREAAIEKHANDAATCKVLRESCQSCGTCGFFFQERLMTFCSQPHSASKKRRVASYNICPKHSKAKELTK